MDEVKALRWLRKAYKLFKDKNSLDLGVMIETLIVSII
jgi:hypothetical protein